MSYTIYINNIKNVLSQYLKLVVSKIDLELHYFNNLYEYILNHNNNIIKINYNLDKNKNIYIFTITINYNDILTYNIYNKQYNCKLIKSDKLIIKRTNNNKMDFLKKIYNNKCIFIHDCENDYNYLLLFCKQIFNKNNSYFYLNYTNNIIDNIYYYNLNKKINFYYINYSIFKKIYNYEYLIYKISNNFLLHKILII